MKIVFIRHGEKLYANGFAKKKKFDPPLKLKEFERGSNLINIYLEEYQGIHPTKIITSPYLRCRQTAEIIRSRCLPEGRIEIENQLSEFLGFQKYVSEQDFDPETYQNNPCGIRPNERENLKMFEKRVRDYISNLLNSQNNNPNNDGSSDRSNDGSSEEVIWIITHGIFINYFLRSIGLPSSRISPFHGIIVENDEVTFI